MLRPVRRAVSTTREVTSGSVDLLRNPTRAAGMAQTAAGLATSLGRVTLMLPDSRTLFKGELSVARRTAWSQPLPLDQVKAVGRATGATVNDVVVASVAGALLIGAMATALTQFGSLVGGRGWDARALAYPVLAVAGGMAGSLFDSLLGATVQGIYYCDHCGKETESALHRCPPALRAPQGPEEGHAARPLRGWLWLNNDLVNFIASIVGGIVAASLGWLFWR